jgi:FKBP-type peptidyl-prolyl cis-trans isomerase 2
MSGEVFDSSKDRDPLEFTLGNQELLAGFEEGVVGLKPGESKTVTLEPEEAFGDRQEDLVLEVAKNEFPQHINPTVGLQLRLTNSSGDALTAVITEVGKESVTVDGNHPMAGQTVVFDIELLEIK